MDPQSPFSTAAISASVHASLDAALTSIPDGKRGAVLLAATLQDGQPAVKVIVAHKINDTWKFGASGQWDQVHGVAGEVAVVGAW